MTRLSPNVPLSTQVANQLRHRIASGEFPVGSRLPSEHELTAQLGVSRNSVREALRALVHAGMLRARAGDGTYVTATSELAPALARRMEEDRAADVAEVRLLLEREGARLAALRATPAHHSQLRALLARRRAARSGIEYVEADIAFHHLLLDASGNVLLAELYRGARGVEESLVRVTPLGADFPAFLRENSELDAAHATLLDAVETGDADRAARAAEALVALARQRPTVGGGGGRP